MTDNTSEVDEWESRRQVSEHLREGLYLIAKGRVLEGRREWRRALSIVPGHNVALDYLVSTDRELTEEELHREKEEIRLGTSGAVVDAREDVDGWGDEVTSEVKAPINNPVKLDHTRVTPPGEGIRAADESWDIEADDVWDITSDSLNSDVAIGASAQTGEEVAAAVDFENTEPGLGKGPGGVGPYRADTVDGMLGRAVAAFHERNYKKAREYLEAILEKDPANSVAFSYISQLEARLRGQLTNDGVPERVIGIDEISGLNLDLVGGYVVSLIDGHTTIEDIYALSSHLDEGQVTRILVFLLEQGVISVVGS